MYSFRFIFTLALKHLRMILIKFTFLKVLILFNLFLLTESIFPQESSQKFFPEEKIVVAGDYQANSFERFFAGDHWRDLWITPVKVPVLDVNEYAGGLTPIEKGGGQQTSSLKFIGGDGKEYRFRSINKDVTRSLPPEFSESIIADAMQDQVSVINPASSVIVASMMDALGILNSKPTICLMPDDERLGEFREEFAGMLGTIQEDPDEYDDESLSFAGADKIVGTFKLYEKLQEDNDEQVDAGEFLKARLFDVLIGDRDRHAGQWDWAGYKEDKKRIWKPIPKDRDFAFPLYDGIFPRMMTVAFISMVHFDYEMPAMMDMTWEGRHMDRRLLSSLDKPVWDSIAVFMQNTLTDSVIEAAVAEMPQEYYALESEQLIMKLISRRDQLKTAADEFYSWVSKYVDVYCSDKDEYAEIKRVNNLFTEVNIYKRDKDTVDKKGSPFFHRILKNSVTEEVRVHLMGGDDIAIVTGEVDEGIRIIVVGGENKDELIDSSKVHGYFLGFTPVPSVKTKTEFYDSGNKTKFVETSGTYINTTKYEETEDELQKYEPLIEDRYMDYGVLLPFEYNTDDGVVLGLGGRINYYDFRQNPFAHRFNLSGSYATKSQRAEFEFLGEFNDMIEGANVKIPAKYTGLEITKFFGLGNETERDDSLFEADYYNVHQRYLGTGFNVKIPTEMNMELSLGLLLELSNILKEDDRLVTEIEPYGIGELDFLAVSASINFDNRDNIEMPFTGHYLNLYSDFYTKTFNNENFFGKLIFDARTYITNELITRTTLALRAYSEMVWGKYPFYKGASIGGSNTLRGFSRDRFVGDHAVLGSAELRFFLADINLLIPFKFGMNLFSDAGRVFYEDEVSKQWHTSFGGGFWFSVYKRTLNLSVNVAKSPEDIRVYVNLGQMF